MLYSFSMCLDFHRALLFWNHIATCRGCNPNSRAITTFFFGSSFVSDSNITSSDRICSSLNLLMFLLLLLLFFILIFSIIVLINIYYICTYIHIYIYIDDQVRGLVDDEFIIYILNNKCTYEVGCVCTCWKDQWRVVGSGAGVELPCTPFLRLPLTGLCVLFNSNYLFIIMKRHYLI